MEKKQLRMYLAALCAGVVTFVAYLPALRNDFVNWDDYGYLYGNPFLGPLNGAFLRWAFTTFYLANWHPLTWLSHGMDHALWGLSPLGHHLTSILVHGANAYLVTMLSFSLLEQRETSVVPTDVPLRSSRSVGIFLTASLGGLFFGLHPVHVESVAWVSERKDVLCAFFFLLSMLSYLKFLRTERAAENREYRAVFPWNRSYLLSLIFFTLALLSKSMAVTLPMVLMIIDWYFLPPFRAGKEFGRSVLQKTPFFALSLAAGIITLYAQGSGFAIASAAELPFGSRVAVAMQSVVSYLRIILFPAGLVPLYPYPEDASLLSFRSLASALAIVGITLLCLVFLKKEKACLAAWVAFLATLLPILGFIHVGSQSLADRYLYIPSIGPLLLLSSAISFAYAYARARKKTFVAAAAVIVVLILATLTVRQTAFWKNGETLWTREVACLPEISTGYTHRADYYIEAGRMTEAFGDINRALSLQPRSPDPFYYRGKVLIYHGFLNEAIADFSRAIAISSYPDFAYFRDRGKAYLELGRTEDALRDYTTAIIVNPLLPDLYQERAIIYDKLDRPEDAILDFTNSITHSTHPRASSYRARGSLYRRVGQSEKANKDILRAERLEQEQSPASDNVRPAAR